MTKPPKKDEINVPEPGADYQTEPQPAAQKEPEPKLPEQFSPMASEPEPKGVKLAEAPSHLSAISGVSLKAEPVRKTTIQTAKANARVVANITYANVWRGSSERGAMELMPIHEIPLLIARVRAEDPGNSGLVQILADYPEGMLNTKKINGQTIVIMQHRYKRVLEDELAQEHARLRRVYTLTGKGAKISLFEQFYGNGVRELKAAMHRIEYAMRKTEESVPEGYEVSQEQMKEVLEFASPDHDVIAENMDFSKFTSFDPMDGAGYDIKAPPAEAVG